CHRTWGISLPSSVPPGSRVRTTVRPCFSSHSASSADWVDLPDPSPPSTVRKRPVTLRPLGWGSLRRGTLCGRLRLRLGRALRPLVCQKLDGALEIDLLDVLTARDGGGGRAVAHVRTEPAVLDPDGLAALRIRLELLQGAGPRPP